MEKTNVMRLILCVCHTRKHGAGFEKSSRCVKGEIGLHDQAEGVAAADGICTRRMLADRHEEAVPDILSSDRRRL